MTARHEFNWYPVIVGTLVVMIVALAVVGILIGQSVRAQ